MDIPEIDLTLIKKRNIVKILTHYYICKSYWSYSKEEEMLRDSVGFIVEDDLGDRYVVETRDGIPHLVPRCERKDLPTDCLRYLNHEEDL